jgi:hypothetical protein
MSHYHAARDFCASESPLAPPVPPCPGSTSLCALNRRRVIAPYGSANSVDDVLCAAGLVRVADSASPFQRGIMLNYFAETLFNRGDCLDRQRQSYCHDL